MQENEEITADIAPEPTGYGDIVTEEPEREVDLGEIDEPKTLTEAEEETEHKTDLQAAMRALLPKFKNKRMNELLQSAMVSRIFPDNFLDKNYLLVMSLIEESEIDDNADIDVVGIISAIQDGLSIGYKGQGRIDILEIAGVAHEEEIEKLAKELGMGA